MDIYAYVLPDCDRSLDTSLGRHPLCHAYKVALTLFPCDCLSHILSSRDGTRDFRSLPSEEVEQQTRVLLHVDRKSFATK